MPGALFYERERQNRYGYHPTATMNHHSHPVIGANPGDSALLYVASWSSSKVLMAQTADPLSAVQEHVQPSFRPSLGEIQARLINRTAAGSASTLIRTPTHTLKCRPHQSDQEATVEHSPINPPTTSQPPTSHHPTTNQCRAKSNGGISPNRPRPGACKYRRRLSIFNKALVNESESPDPAKGGSS